MTHLSDFSFLQRMVSFGYLYVWMLYRVFTLDRFSCLHPKKFQQGELKSIVTLLILFMIPFQLFYDITSVKIKYEEGFANVLGRIFTKPEVMWTKADRNLVVPTEYSLCIGFSLQTGTLVLLQCFWNYLANSVAKENFMSSKEFMFYICWTISSFILFPLLQYNFSRDIYEATYKEIIPEMVYGIELFIVSCLGVMSHFRFKKLLQHAKDTPNGRAISQKICYFQEINIVLSTALFGHGSLLTTLSIDGLTIRKYLNIHKFSADFFICNINMCAVITWLCMILIFHPKHNQTNEPTSESAEDGTTKQLLNNHSGISSIHAPTLTIGPSQASSDYMYKGGGVHPLSKSTTSSSSQCDSAFQYGPLPIAPSNDTFRNKNNSIASTAPSMATLVHHGSHGKSHYKDMDSFHISIPDDAKPIKPFDELENEEEYSPPPLSPARKNREHSLRVERYTHSMNMSGADIGEFGIDFKKQQEMNSSMLSTFKDNTMRHSTSSLLLPLPFEGSSQYSINSEFGKDALI